MTKLAPAEKLLQSLGIQKPKDIDLEAIAWHCGAKVRREQLDGCEARIIGNKDKAIITIAEDRSLERQRFSIGHELGHWEHHRGQAFTCRAEDIGNNGRPFSTLDPERVADEYSSDLLLPDYMFKPLVNKTTHTCFDVASDLKKLFQTSFTATSLRLVKHAQEPCILLCHDAGGKRIWFKGHRDIPDVLFPKDNVDADTYAADVLSGKDESSSPRKMPADAWFDGDAYSHYEIHEETVRIDRGRILTLLTWRDEAMLERYAA